MKNGILGSVKAAEIDDRKFIRIILIRMNLRSLAVVDLSELSRCPKCHFSLEMRIRGNLFENAILLELRKHQLNRGLDPALFYYRDIQKNEVDIIYKKGHNLIPIEIKSSKTYHPEFIEKLRNFQTIAKGRAPKAFLVYAGEAEQHIQTTYILNFKHAPQAIE